MTIFVLIHSNQVMKLSTHYFLLFWQFNGSQSPATATAIAIAVLGTGAFSDQSVCVYVCVCVCVCWAQQSGCELLGGGGVDDVHAGLRAPPEAGSDLPEAVGGRGVRRAQSHAHRDPGRGVSGIDVVAALSATGLVPSEIAHAQDICRSVLASNYSFR